MFNAALLIVSALDFKSFSASLEHAPSMNKDAMNNSFVLIFFSFLFFVFVSDKFICYLQDLNSPIYFFLLTDYSSSNIISSVISTAVDVSTKV